MATFPNYTSGSGTAYGKAPNATPMPKSLYDEAAAANPALFALDQKSTGVINNQLSGTLSPETIKLMQDNAATFGVFTGMPGSGLQQNRGLRDLGTTVEQMQQQGLGNYQNALKSLSSMQLDPSLVSGLNTYNNQLEAAPDPAAAAAQEENLYQSHYAQIKRDSEPKRGAGSWTGWTGASGYPSSIGGSSSMFKPNAGNAAPTGTGTSGGYPPAFAWNAGGGSNFTPNTGTSNFFSSPGTTFIPSNSGYGSGGMETWSNPLTTGGNSPYIYHGDPANEPAYNDKVYFGDAPGGDWYDAMLDPSSPDYQPGGAQ